MCAWRFVCAKNKGFSQQPSTVKAKVWQNDNGLQCYICMNYLPCRDVSVHTYEKAALWVYNLYGISGKPNQPKKIIFIYFLKFIGFIHKTFGIQKIEYFALKCYGSGASILWDLLWKMHWQKISSSYYLSQAEKPLRQLKLGFRLTFWVAFWLRWRTSFRPEVSTVPPGNQMWPSDQFQVALRLFTELAHSGTF